MRSPIQSIPASIHPATLASFMVLPGLQYLFFVSYNLTPYPIMAKLNSLVSKSAGMSLFLSPALPQSPFFQGACPWFRFAGQMFLDCQDSYSCSAGYWLDSHYHHIYPSYTLPCNWLVGHYLHKPLIAWLPVSTTPSNSRFPQQYKNHHKNPLQSIFPQKTRLQKTGYNWRLHAGPALLALFYLYTFGKYSLEKLCWRTGCFLPDPGVPWVRSMGPGVSIQVHLF